MQSEKSCSNLRILLTRLGPDRHRLEIVRVDGSRESRTLETRSLLTHDLIHYAVEAEAGLTGGFYGRVAAGRALDAVDDITGEALCVERVVGALTGLLAADPPPAAEAFVDGFAVFLSAYGEAPPSWLTPAYIDAVRERLRRLLGQWRATPFGETMELGFARPGRERGDV